MRLRSVNSANGATGRLTLNWGLNTAASANLSVTLSGHGSATEGATLAYTLSVSNAGPQSATGLLTAVTIPTGLSVAGLPAACAEQSNTLTCPAGELANGASLAYTLSLRVDNLAGPVGLSATLSSDLPDSIDQQQYLAGAGTGCS